ncbi:MAG: histidinol-phosphatase [Bowdeniella nasicola]|nr:histidinol-phosphatase [Bowdeniella nasicola]
MTSLHDDLEFALNLADSADSLTAKRFWSQDFHVETKPDMSLVTDADRQTERLLADQIARERPTDSIYGEEFGTRGHASRQWIIDPIDGTANFVRGVPVWATLIALAVDDEVHLGVVSAPALGRRWWAATAMGAYTSRLGGPEQRIAVSNVRAIADASLSFSSLHGWQERGLREEFYQLTSQVWRTRAYGDFWSYMLVAEGVVDIACEPDLEVYDMAALAPIVREAGGVFTGVNGTPGPFGRDAIATNGPLHDQVREILTPQS